MKRLELHIKGMVCTRCETIIRQEISKLNGRVLKIKPGYAEVEIPEGTDKQAIAQRLQSHRFELLEDAGKQLVQQIKTATMEYVKHQEEAAANKQKPLALSEFVAKHIGRDYSALSKLFSREEGQTLEHYYILLRIERVKELLDYDELNVSEIADKLGYSSVHYLSTQFKKITGISVTTYRKNIECLGRNYLNEL
jgi:YesN/AraC family two-component response regulator